MSRERQRYESRLARPGQAHHDQELAGAYVEVDVCRPAATVPSRSRNGRLHHPVPVGTQIRRVEARRPCKGTGSG